MDRRQRPLEGRALKPSSSEQGLSLIEVLVAVLIVGLALATASQAAW